MSPRKRDEITEPFDYDEALAHARQTMRELHLPRIEELPRIELYLDQVLSIVSLELAPLYEEDERIITGSMVNNYVKQKVIPAPVRKRYTRAHLARILVVCIFKRALPIPQVVQLMELSEESGLDLAEAYDQLCGVLEQALVRCFRAGDADQESYAVEDVLLRVPDAVLDQLLVTAVEMVAGRVYLDRMLALETRREHARSQEA